MLHKDAPWDAQPCYLTGDVNPLLHNPGHNFDIIRNGQKQKTPYLILAYSEYRVFWVLFVQFKDFTKALRSGKQLLADLRVSVAHGLGAHFVTVRQALGTNELDVGDTEEAEQ